MSVAANDPVCTLCGHLRSLHHAGKGCTAAGLFELCTCVVTGWQTAEERQAQRAAAALGADGFVTEVEFRAAWTAEFAKCPSGYGAENGVGTLNRMVDILRCGLPMLLPHPSVVPVRLRKVEKP